MLAAAPAGATGPAATGLRVALVAPFGLRPKGTTSARVMPLARVLAAGGAAVRVVIPPWDDPARSGARWSEGGVQVAHTRSAPPAGVLLDLWRLVRAWRPDVVHCFKPIGYSGTLAWAMAATRRGGRPAVIVDADDLEGPEGWAGRRGQRLSGMVRGFQERRALRAADRVTVASRWLADFARSSGVASDVLYLPNGHETQLPSEPVAGGDRCDAPRLLWYTRFTEAQPARAASLVAPLLRADGRARLAIVGEEIGQGAQSALRDALASERVDGQVDWLGYEPEAVERYAAEHSRLVAIYPLDDDAVNRARCPSKVPQLMAMGLPVVAEAVGEAGSYLAGFEDASLVPAGDARRFREQVGRLLADSTLRATVRARLRGASQRWRWEVVAEGLPAWYRSVLSEGPHR